MSWPPPPMPTHAECLVDFRSQRAKVRPRVGLMLWFSLNGLVGSYLFFSSTKRS